MDEILATIRRIIAEDELPGGPSATGAASATATGAATASMATAGSAAGNAAGGHDRGAAANDTAGDADDDIVELTEALNEDGTVRHLAPIGGTSRIAVSREPASVVAAVASAPEPSASDAPSPPATPRQAGAPEPAPTPEPTAAPEPADTPEPAGMIGDRLVSTVASSATAAAVANLAAAPPEPHPEREPPPGSADRTLENIVRDLLQPLMRTWLDEHLPGIVERLVQAEIARTGKPGPT